MELGELLLVPVKEREMATVREREGGKHRRGRRGRGAVGALISGDVPVAGVDRPTRRGRG